MYYKGTRPFNHNDLITLIFEDSLVNIMLSNTINRPDGQLLSCKRHANHCNVQWPGSSREGGQQEFLPNDWILVKCGNIKSGIAYHFITAGIVRLIGNGD